LYKLSDLKWSVGELQSLTNIFKTIITAELDKTSKKQTKCRQVESLKIKNKNMKLEIEALKVELEQSRSQIGSPKFFAKMPQTEQTFEQTTHDFSGSQSISLIQSGYLKS
jgi:hypothetical protein